jgi:hypothetical protein
MESHPHLPGAGHQEDQKWLVGALAGQIGAHGLLPRLSGVEVPEDDLVEQRRVEVAELMRQGMLDVIPGMNVKVAALITRSLNKGEQVMIRPFAEGVGTPGPRLQEECSLLFSDLDVVRMCAAQ